MPIMRAKMCISGIEIIAAGEGVTQEKLTMHAVVSDESFGENGESENNTYSRWTPSANLSMVITNPELLGKFQVGEEYYLDFTKAEN